MDSEYTGKYAQLSSHLLNSQVDVLPMTFDEIERVVGLTLPQSARQHQAWWANQPRGQANAWLSAGFKTASVSVDEERLTFIRDHGGPPQSSADNDLPKVEMETLTIAQAKERLAHSLGISPTQIEIIIKA